MSNLSDDPYSRVRKSGLKLTKCKKETETRAHATNAHEETRDQNLEGIAGHSLSADDAPAHDAAASVRTHADAPSDTADVIELELKKLAANKLLTRAERAHRLAALHKRRSKVLAKLSKTHKERVDEFNKKLSGLSEHFDVPKVGPG